MADIQERFEGVSGERGHTRGTVSLFRRHRQPQPQPADFPVVTLVQQYWEGLRQERIAPKRADIDPAALASCLGHVFVAEFVAPGVARLRLNGQHLVDLIGMETRGMPLTVFFEPEAREAIDAALKQVADGARVLLPIRSRKAYGCPTLDGQLALMPLADHVGQISRVLGVIETIGPIGRAPRRFVLASDPLNRPSTSVPQKGRHVIGRANLKVIDGGLR